MIDKSNSIDWNNSNKKIDQDKCKLLCSLLDKLQNEQTLIYCSTPARARRMAKIYLEHLQNIERKKEGNYHWLNGLTKIFLLNGVYRKNCSME